MKIARIFGWAFVVMMFVAPYSISAQSQNAWPGVLAFAGILLAWIGTTVYMVQEKLGGYLIPAVFSLGALGLAVWLSRLTGGWWWTIIWPMVALAHYATAVDAWQEEDRHMRIALALGLLSTAAAVLLPWLVAPILQGREVTLPPTFWMWLLLILGLAALAVAWYQGYRKSEEGRFVWWGFLGVGLLAGATGLSRLVGGWWWSLPWVLAALALGHAARDLRQYSFGRAAGNFGLALALLCLIAAVAIPALLPRVLEGEARIWPPSFALPFPIPLHLDVRAGWRSLGTFLLSALWSIWGIFHLLTLFSLGYLWLRRGRGGVSILLLLLFTIWLAGAYGSSIDDTLTHVFSTSPVTWMKEMLLFSSGQWGNIAWGILLTAFLTSLVLVPVIRLSSKFNRVWSVYAGSELTQSAMQRMTRALRMMDVRPLDSVLAFYILLVIPIGLWVALWVALRQIAPLGDLPLGFAYIPDLTIPHWKPIWSLRYYSLGLVLGLATMALLYLQKKYEPTLFPGCVSNSSLLVGTLLTVSIAPAGVVLFSIAVILSQILLFPTRIIRMPTVPILRPPPPSTTRPPMTTPQIEIPIPILETPAKPIAGSSVWNSPAPIAAMLEWQGVLWFLNEDGGVVRCGDETRESVLPILRGHAIFALREDDDPLLVVGNGDRVLWLDRSSLQAVRQVTLSQSVEAATLNPYRTMLAWVNTTDGTAGILLLASGTEVALARDLNLAPTLAFSADGRYLALGSSDGAIHLVDIATRKISDTLHLPEGAPSRGQAVRALFGREGGGWVSVYADRRIVLWGADRQGWFIFCLKLVYTFCTLKN